MVSKPIYIQLGAICVIQTLGTEVLAAFRGQRGWQQSPARSLAGPWAEGQASESPRLGLSRPAGRPLSPPARLWLGFR